MRINVWVNDKKDIPEFAELTGKTEAEITELFEVAEKEGILCIFKIEMSPEDYYKARSRRWYGR
jgi:hypothetical protein